MRPGSEHPWFVFRQRNIRDRKLDRLLADHLQDERLENLPMWLPRYARLLGVDGTVERLEQLQHAIDEVTVVIGEVTQGSGVRLS